MIAVLGTNIFSPLGRTSRENYLAVKGGRSALTALEGWKGIPERITASVFDPSGSACAGSFGFEEIAAASIAEALKGIDIDLASPRTLLVVSTTKGDIEALSEATASAYKGPAGAAQRIADRFGVTTRPVIVCNACTSGGNAQLLAARLLEAGKYDNAIVCGADTVSAFTVAGFVSFKAMSPYECRPFDIERLGLNLGEAAATMILGRVPDNGACRWVLESGALTNDAYHDSAPSPDGDGVYRALTSVLDGIAPEDLDCISLHGTATMFNDQMESKAVQRAGLSDVPATALKGYYGHTLGAAGLVESIITMEAVDDGVVLPTRGFEEIGVSGKISISAGQRRTAGKRRFVKVLSGFGGCNCAVRYSRGADASSKWKDFGRVKVLGHVSLDSNDDPVDIYRTELENYPKFHKMDRLARLSYVAAELLLKQAPGVHPEAVILFNGTSSILQDRRHINTIMGPDGFFPSPSVFLYTLPNLAIGEIAIRHGIKGETVMYILQEKNPCLMDEIVEATLPKWTVAVTGWVDCSADDVYEADLNLVTII